MPHISTTKMKKDKTAADYVQRHRKKQANEGLVLVQVKVPANRRGDVLETARKMRDGEI